MIRKLLAMLAACAAVSVSAQGTVSASTGIIATDWNGVTYDIDALLAAGKHIWVHQMFQG